MKLTTICFLIKDGKVLLADKKRGFGKGFLNGYGGKVQDGETPERAAVRELFEEASAKADISNLDKVAVIEFFDGVCLVFECHVFFVNTWTGEPKESEEMSLPEWFALESVPYERMWKSDREWLPLIFSGKRIYGKAYYKAGMNEMDRFEYDPLRKHIK